MWDRRKRGAHRSTARFGGRSAGDSRELTAIRANGLEENQSVRRETARRLIDIKDDAGVIFYPAKAG
jgi:hypothetical protein